MKYIKIIIAVALSGVLFTNVSAEKAASLDELLNQVKQGKIRESKENQAREAEFKRDRGRQQQLLAQAKKDRANLEARSAQLEKRFEANQDQIDVLKNAYKNSLGDLKELFGVLQTASGDARATFENSYNSIEYPNRSEFLKSSTGITGGSLLTTMQTQGVKAWIF